MFSHIARRWFTAVVLALFVGIIVLQLAACGGRSNQTSSMNSGNSAYKPITIQNCGNTLTFTKAPTRVISTLQNTTDILLALGLGSRIVGIYYGQLYQPEPEYNDQYQKLPDLGGDMMSMPSKEKVLSTRPDFIFSAYPAGDFLASYGAVTQEQFKAQGAQIYGMSGECAEDSNRVRMTSVYGDILNIGRIFGVEKRAQQVVNMMKARIEAVQKRITQRPLSPVIAMPVFSSTQATAPVTVVGAGIYTDILHQAGGNNLFGTQNKTYPSISQESFAVQKAEVYVLINYRGADPAKFTSYLFSTYPNIPASKQHRVVIINANQWNAGMLLPDVVEQLARTFHREAFQ